MARDRHTVDHHREVMEELSEAGKHLRSAIPHVYEGFQLLHRNAMRDGAIPIRIKEAMALAISVVNQCDGCIAFHARAAARSGSTEEEVGEALGVAILLSGGPGTVYAPRAWQAYQEFKRAEPS